IVVIGDRQRRRAAPIPLVGDNAARIEPAEQNAGDIGERIPADRERTEADQHRIELGIGYERERHESSLLDEIGDAVTLPSRQVCALRGRGRIAIVARDLGCAAWRAETTMTQTSNRIFDEFARLMNDAAGVASGVRREFDTLFRTQ